MINCQFEVGGQKPTNRNSNNNNKIHRNMNWMADCANTDLKAASLEMFAKSCERLKFSLLLLLLCLREGMPDTSYKHSLGIELGKVLKPIC